MDYAPLPLILPPLPNTKQPWSVGALNAYNILSDVFNKALEILQQEPDSLRLNHHISLILGDIIPLVDLLEQQQHAEGFTQEWLNAVALSFGTLVIELRKALDASTTDGR